MWNILFFIFIAALSIIFVLKQITDIGIHDDEKCYGTGEATTQIFWTILFGFAIVLRGTPERCSRVFIIPIITIIALYILFSISNQIYLDGEVFIIICLIIIYHLIIALIAYHTLHVKSGFFFTWRQYIIAVLSVLLQFGVFFRDTLMYEKETIIHAIIHVLCFVFAAAIPIISF